MSCKQAVGADDFSSREFRALVVPSEHHVSL
jgi:hypothetical protein